jgi:hypothetical protein
MLDRTGKSTIDRAQGLAKGSTDTRVREPLTALDDSELSHWLMACVEDGSENFLCAVAEAALAANPEEYIIIRPALLTLRRKRNPKHPTKAS